MKRTYTIPLRRKFRNTQRNMRAKKAVTVAKEFLEKHMKSTDVKLGRALNEQIWSRGMKNPPGKVTVICEKDEDGVVFADLEGEMLRSEIEATKKPADEKKIADKKSASITLEDVKGLGPAKIAALKEAGIKDAQALAQADEKTVSEVEGIGEATAKKFIEAAKKATK